MSILIHIYRYSYIIPFSLSRVHNCIATLVTIQLVSSWAQARNSIKRPPMQCQSDERRRKLDQRQCPREIECRNIGEGLSKPFFEGRGSSRGGKNRTKSIPFRDISKTASFFHAVEKRSHWAIE